MTIVSDGLTEFSKPATSVAGAVRTSIRPANQRQAVRPVSIPAEVEFILSALEAGHATAKSGDRRRAERVAYRVCASLKLYSDPEGALPWQIFSRDVCPQGLGFLTRHRLPLGYGGILTLMTPQGASMKFDCTVVRCREAVQGWFEGSMYFNREQGCFASDHVLPRES